MRDQHISHARYDSTAFFRIKEKINSTVNQPSSKQPELNKDTGTDPDKKKKKRKKKRKGRAGEGNQTKPEPDVVNQNPLTICPDCQTDLTTQPVVANRSRLVEDIPPTPEKTIVSEEVQERKWCPTCVKQTCMAHILRKIRKFRDAYPQHYCIVQFYQKLRRILADGDRLQSARKELGEEVFMWRLGLSGLRVFSFQILLM